jgi:hypothetical protein
MRHLHSQFHFRHALFALQGPDGYVDALMESARESGRAAKLASRRQRTRSGMEPREVQAALRR